MRGAVVAAVAVIAILVGAGVGFGYEYSTLSGQISGLNQSVSHLNETVSSQAQQISSQSSEVPDSEIFGVQYAMTLYSDVNGTLGATAFYTIWDIGLLYHSGHNTTLYVDASQLFNFTGMMNVTYIGTRTGGFGVSSISPSLPQTVDSGLTYGNRSVITLILSTPASPYRGFLQMYVQAYLIS